VADLKLTADITDLVRARQEVRKWGKESKDAIDIVNSRMTRMGNTSEVAFDRISKGARRASSDIQRFENTSRKSMRRVEIIAQQAGYQIGDLAVQIQSGTNAAVALGQQGSQLLGFFGPAGAIAGAALAIGTGLIAPFIKASKEVKESEDAVKSLIEEIDSLREKRISEVFDIDPKAVKIAQKRIELANKIARLETEADVAAATGRQEAAQGKRDLVATLEEQLAKETRLFQTRLKTLEKSRQEAKERKEQKDWEEGAEERLLTLNARRFEFIMKQAEAARKQKEAQEKINETAEEQLRKLKQQNDIYIAQINYGLESEAVERVKAKHVIENLRASLEKKGVDEEIIKRIIEQQKELQTNKELVEDTVTEASKLGEALGIGFAEAVKLIRQAKAEATVGLDAFGGAGEFKYSTPSTFKPPTTTKTRGVKKVDPLGDLRKQLALENRMAGQTEARQRIMQALGDTYDSTSEKTIEQLEKQINVINEVKRAEEDRLQIQQTVESAFEDGFMSMIDGSKSVTEAFKDMARQIIAELYRVMVVQRMVRAISGFLPFADGGVFSGGSQVKAFANGGIVGGPTYFPMSGGQTGLMGEAGPEAIMPLKRGKDGKLGVEAQGGGQVIVNQTINVSTGVQQTVRTEIKALMPQIAANTKAAVADAKRRGGSYGKAF
jgi:hypothetical protein